jgi:hypothetical protein
MNRGWEKGRADAEAWEFETRGKLAPPTAFLEVIDLAARRETADKLTSEALRP